jgi:hypothetical protein
VRIALVGPARPEHGGAARHTTELASEVPIVIARMPPVSKDISAERATDRAPGDPRAGVRPPDPGPYWSAYLRAVLP